MAGNTEIISKGIYGRAQMGGYISVKQYMFIRYMDKKHLLVRFSNDLDVAIECIAYTVVQMNVNGDVIGVSRVEHCERIKPGESFSSENALMVDEACIDVKITVDKAVSGSYEYSVRGGIVSVNYNPNALNSKSLHPPKLISAPKKGKDGTTSKITAFAIAAIVLVLLINVICAFAPIIKKELLCGEKGPDIKENVLDDGKCDDVAFLMSSNSYNFDDAE